MSKIPQSLTTVTLFSKILATIILVLIVPMASFYAGMQYQKTESIAQLELPTAVTHSQQVKSAAEKAVRDYLQKYTLPTSLASQRIAEYRLYEAQNILEKGKSLFFDITYAVKPISKTSNAFWLSGNGVLESSGWITGKKMSIEAVKKNGFYQITTITPLN